MNPPAETGHALALTYASRSFMFALNGRLDEAIAVLNAIPADPNFPHDGMDVVMLAWMDTLLARSGVDQEHPLDGQPNKIMFHNTGTGDLFDSAPYPGYELAVQLLLCRARDDKDEYEKLANTITTDTGFSEVVQALLDVCSTSVRQHMTTGQTFFLPHGKGPR